MHLDSFVSNLDSVTDTEVENRSIISTTYRIQKTKLKKKKKERRIIVKEIHFYRSAWNLKYSKYLCTYFISLLKIRQKFNRFPKEK